MKKSFIILSINYLFLFAIMLIVSCKGNQSQLSQPESSAVKDSIALMMSNIQKDISSKGPAAWLNYFNDAPGFFMASGGQLVLTDYPSAKTFILGTLVKNIHKINLQWSNIRIDQLTPQLAAIGADFHEDLTDAMGKVLSIDGYFTGTATFIGKSWKLRNLHWSIKAPVK